MRNVRRAQEPDSLRLNAKKWTRELLRAIKANKGKGKSVPEKYYNKYKQSDILTTLQRMYSDSNFTYCCYCESIVDMVSFEHIEHRMPKSKYPKHTYDWNNLHIVCEKCNNYKGDKYDESAPILDAVTDKISEHLSYRLGGINGVFQDALTRCGVITIQHAYLNRPSLLKGRLDIYHDTINAIAEIIRLKDHPKSYVAKEILLNKCSGQFGSVIQFALNQFDLSRN
jgi:uncharacterized protein (TIGR02646 family)